MQKKAFHTTLTRTEFVIHLHDVLTCPLTSPSRHYNLSVVHKRQIGVRRLEPSFGVSPRILNNRPYRSARTPILVPVDPDSTIAFVSRAVPSTPGVPEQSPNSSQTSRRFAMEFGWDPAYSTQYDRRLKTELVRPHVQGSTR